MRRAKVLRAFCGCLSRWVQRRHSNADSRLQPSGEDPTAFAYHRDVKSCHKKTFSGLYHDRMDSQLLLRPWDKQVECCHLLARPGETSEKQASVTFLTHKRDTIRAFGARKKTQPGRKVTVTRGLNKTRPGLVPQVCPFPVHAHGFQCATVWQTRLPEDFSGVRVRHKSKEW